MASPKSQRTIILVDATNSMTPLIAALSNVICGVDASLGIQIVGYRNYDSDAEHLLTTSGWTTDTSTLSDFAKNLEARGGWESEAIEVALDHALKEHRDKAIDQIILIGDAAPNNRRETDEKRSDEDLGAYGQEYWDTTDFSQVVYYEDLIREIRSEGIPVYTIHLLPGVKAAFEEMSSDGSSTYLCMDDPDANQQLLRFLGARVGLDSHTQLPPAPSTTTQPPAPVASKSSSHVTNTTSSAVSPPAVVAPPKVPAASTPPKSREGKGSPKSREEKGSDEEEDKSSFSHSSPSSYLSSPTAPRSASFETPKPTRNVPMVRSPYEDEEIEKAISPTRRVSSLPMNGHRTLLLIESTTQTASLFTQTTVSRLFHRVSRILQSGMWSPDIELKVIAYRNYDNASAKQIIQMSPEWATSSSDLTEFCQKLVHKGGSGGALELALEIALREHRENPVGQVIIVGSATPNTGEETDAKRAHHGEKYWSSKDEFRQPVYFSDMIEQLHAADIPVHAMFLHPSAREAFEDMRVAPALSQYLDPGVRDASARFIDFLAKAVLQSATGFDVNSSTRYDIEFGGRAN